MDDLVRAVDARELTEQRSKALGRFEEHVRELALSPPLERLAAIERELDLIEQYARDTGLFRREETIEFRLGRFMSRWKLGEALARIERAAGPGRGKKDSGAADSFLALLEKLGVAWDAATEAQRIACLPPEDLEKFCANARASGDVPRFSELLTYARPYWYEEAGGRGTGESRADCGATTARSTPKSEAEQIRHFW
jgi:hypothetical protein